MNNKSVLAVVTAQTAVILGLLYLLWNLKTNELILTKNSILFLALISVTALVTIIILQTKKTDDNKETLRRDGTVKWFSPSKGFGFIEQDVGDDLFVHQSEIRQSGFRYLNLGDRVEFEVGLGKKGPVALKVIRTRPADPEKYPDYYEEPEEDQISQVSETQLN